MKKINKIDLERILPNDLEKSNMWFEEWAGRTFNTNGMEASHKTTFQNAQKVLIDFILSRCTNLSNAEQLAIEEYKMNKISAVKFLMSENNIGLKDAKDFLDKHSNLSVTPHEA